MVIKKDTLDQLLAGRDPRDVFAKDGLVDELKKALANRVLSAELDDHLDGEAAAGKANRRNGYSKKTVLGESSKLELRIPRDREGYFRSQADRQVPAPLSRLRRKDHLDVRPGDERPRDPGPSAGDLWPRRLARPDLDGDRRRAGDRDGVAEPAAGDELPADLL